MSPWRWTVVGGAVTQIALGVVLYAGDLCDARARLGLTALGLAGGAALLGLVAQPVRGPAAALNGLMFLLCVPQLFIGLLEGFTTPAGSPLGGWLYPVVVVWSSAGAANAAALHRLHARSQSPGAEPDTAPDPDRR